MGPRRRQPPRPPPRSDRAPAREGRSGSASSIVDHRVLLREAPPLQDPRVHRRRASSSPCLGRDQLRLPASVRRGASITRVRRLRRRSSPSVVLLVVFCMLRSQDVWEQLRLYATRSALRRRARLRRGGERSPTVAELFALGAVTDRVQGSPGPAWRSASILRQPRRRRRGCPPSYACRPRSWSGSRWRPSRSSRSRPSGIAHHGSAAARPRSPVAVAVVLVAFQLMIVRPYAPSQLLGFLVLENGVSLATLVIAPSMPLVLALLLLFDVFVGLLVFVLLIQYLGMQRTAVTTDILDQVARLTMDCAPRRPVRAAAGRRGCRARRRAARTAETATIGGRGARAGRGRSAPPSTSGHGAALGDRPATGSASTRWQRSSCSRPGFLYAVGAVYSVGYLRADERRRRPRRLRAPLLRLPATSSAGRCCSSR